MSLFLNFLQATIYFIRNFSFELSCPSINEKTEQIHESDTVKVATEKLGLKK